MNALFPDNALLSHLFPSGLKLGLYQAHHLAFISQKLFYRSQHFCQGYKGHINAGKFNAVPYILRGHVPDVCFLHTDDPVVIAQLPGKLSMSHVHGIHLHRPVLEHTVRKSAGGSPYVHTYLACQLNAEAAHGLFQLKPSPADIFKGVSPDLNLYCLLKGRARLIFLLSIDIDYP